MRQPGSTLETVSGYEPQDRVELFHGAVKVNDGPVPVEYTMALPKHHEAESLGLIVPGLGAFKRTSRDLRNHLAADESLNMAVISYDPLRANAKNTDRVRDLLNPQELHFETVSRILHDITINPRVQKSARARFVADEPVTLLPHSMGGMPAAEYALEYPDTVKEIAYIGCVGLQDAIGVKLIGRGIKEIALDIAPKVIAGKFGYHPRTALKSAKYFMTNIPRTVSEIVSCTQADIRPQVLELARLGIRQSFICLGKDIFFPPEETHDGIGVFIGTEHIYIMEGAGHVDPQVNPSGTTRFIGQVLTASRPVTPTSVAVA